MKYYIRKNVNFQLNFYQNFFETVKKMKNYHSNDHNYSEK